MLSSSEMPTRAGRPLFYLIRMFPPHLVVPYGVANFLAIYWTLQALAGEASLALTWRAAAGAATVVLFALLLRVYDDLKDVETDLKLGAAGDPRFQDRPIVKGEITGKDLRLLRWIVTALLLGLNAPLGFPWPLAAFASVFVLTWLSLRWFFCPAISRNLLLAFATHNPLALAVSGYVVAVFVADFGPRLTIWTAPLLVGLWAPVAAWEVSRKIRVEADETGYPTYSKLLGWRRAAFVPAIFAAISALCLVPTAFTAGLGRPYPAVLLAAALLLAGRCILFRVAPTRSRANLRPWAELFAIVATAGLAAVLGFRYGTYLR